MWRRLERSCGLRRALDGALRAVITVALVLLTLPHATAATPQYAVLAVVVDGRPSEHIGRFLLQGGVPQASVATWRACGLRLADAWAPDAVIGVADLPGVQHRIDADTQTLYIEQPLDLSQVTVLGTTLPPAAPLTPSAWGAMVNYDAVAQRSAERISASALVQARLFGPAFTLEHAAIVSYTREGQRQVRLDTTVEHVDAARALRVAGGDIISGALGWTRPVRMAGVQARTDFSMRPDLVTTPSPQLGGTASVPSTVDVLVNGVRQLSQAVEPGRFELRQLPVVSGTGDVALVVRDALGRESVQTLAFYAAPRQLAQGLREFSLEAGRVRRRYGLASNDYGTTAAIGSLRAGVRHDLTLEAHAEATRDTALLGGGAVYALPGWAAFAADAGASHGGGQSGRRGGLSVERQTAGGHVALAVARASAGFRDVAATQGDAIARRSLRASGGTSLGRWGSVGLAYVDLLRHPLTALQPGRELDATRRRIATASWSVPIGQRLQTFVSAYRDLGATGQHGVALHLSMPLGRRVSAGAGVTRERGGSTANVHASQPDFVEGDWGWRIQRDQVLSGGPNGATSRQHAEIAYRTPLARLSAATEHVAGTQATRLAAQGALLAIDGSVHASQPVIGSVAVVEVPAAPGVGVYHENRWVGRTDASGRVVVPNLLPFQPNRISIDPLDLPLDADIATPSAELRPGDRTGVLLRFGVTRHRSALVALRDGDGKPLPLGAIARVEGEDLPQPVGHDGLAVLRGLGRDSVVRVSWDGRERCSARVALDGAAAHSGRIGPVPCL